MKKFLLGLTLLIFLLLSLLYLAVNSPYVIDKIARKYAPEYGFDYRKIIGDPLHGITLEDLRYKGKELARKIRVRINPYTLLEKQLTVSRLQLTDVNTTVLEKVINNFATPSADDNASESSGMGLPVSVELQNIHLTLLPFERYGIRVYKEELSVDSIYYDGKRFNVGRLRQVAETSIGNVELEGTYHKRFLDVELLAVDHLNLTELEKSIRLIAGESTTATTTEETPPTRESSAQASTVGTEGEDLFLPKRIHAKRLWITLLPYQVSKGLKLDWTQLEGKNLDMDLEQMKLLGGMLTANLQSNLAEARLRMKIEKDKVTLEEGVLSGLDLDAVLALTQRGDEGAKSPETSESKASAKESYDTLPFVPRIVDARQLRVELKPGTFEGVGYTAAVANIRNLHLDLHEEKMTAETLQAYLNTPLVRADIESSIGPDAIRVRSLALRDVDLEKILAWQKSHGKESSGTKESKSVPSPKKAKGESGSKGLKLPFVPSVIDLDEGLVTLRPYPIDSIELKRSKLSLRKVRFDLTKMLADGGTLSLDLRSNLARLDLEGKIRKNRLLIVQNGKNRILLEKSLYDTYRLPLRPEALSPITIEGVVGEEGTNLKLSFHGRRLLADRNGIFNVDIDRSLTTLRYDFADGNFTVVNESKISTPQAPTLNLQAKLFRRPGEPIRYQGTLESGGVKLGDEKIEKMFGKPRIDFRGDLHSVKADLDAGLFSGHFLSPDFKKGHLSLRTKKRIIPARYFKLPRELSKAWVTMQVEVPVDFSSPLPLDANLSIHSNLANLGGTVDYDGNLTAKIVTRFPKDSLLHKMLPALNLAALNPLQLSVEQGGEKWKVRIASSEIQGDILYALDSDQLKGMLKIAGSKVKIEGKPSGTILATLQARSVKGMLNRIRKIYKVALPKFDGDISLKLQIEKLTKASLEIRSKQFIPDESARIKSPIKNLSLLLTADLKKKNLILQRYGLEVGGMKLFATKPSIVHLEGHKILLRELWLNDSLKATGSYDLKRKKGTFKSRADRFHVQHENADLYAAVDITANVVGEKIEAKGKITLLGGNVMYNIQAKHYATDDIIILQHQKEKKESFFEKNVQLMLYIDAKKPLLFKQKDVYVELKPQLSVLKSFGGDLQLLGSIQLAKNGYYIFEGKRFVLSPSSINFTGKPTEPLLDINLVYRRYSRTVYITVNGVASEPNINFSSDPFMTRSQILSFIMFDTVDSGENAGDMLSMVGGGVAKSILNNIGLKVDTMVVTTGGFEVGKKITDKITLIYDQEAKNPRVIVRIQYSKRTETDISIGSESQSVDIIYKREF
ncbi:translocation/assembly module TamB domain-containing protein [Nitratifractor sp.]